MKMGIFNFRNKKNGNNIIEYLPEVGFVLDSKKIKWENDRLETRNDLDLDFKEDDKFIDMSKYFDGDTDKNIQQKRDVYKNVNSDNDLFFLNYDSNNKLVELEVHDGFEIKIGNFQLDFNTKLLEIIKRFNQEGTECVKLEEGNYLLPKLKITIADSESMGGNGKKLSYFYCSSDVSHLLR
jgi:hypothetical protein